MLHYPFILISLSATITQNYTNHPKNLSKCPPKTIVHMNDLWTCSTSLTYRTMDYSRCWSDTDNRTTGRYMERLLPGNMHTIWSHAPWRAWRWNQSLVLPPCMLWRGILHSSPQPKWAPQKDSAHLFLFLNFAYEKRSNVLFGFPSGSYPNIHNIILACVAHPLVICLLS